NDRDAEHEPEHQPSDAGGGKEIPAAASPPGDREHLVGGPHRRGGRVEQALAKVTHLVHDDSFHGADSRWTRARTARRSANPRAVWLFTVPIGHTSRSATSSTDRSAQNRSTRTARRCLESRSNAVRRMRRSSAPRSSTLPAPSTAFSGSVATSRRHGRRRSSKNARTNTRRVYWSRAS